MECIIRDAAFLDVQKVYREVCAEFNERPDMLTTLSEAARRTGLTDRFSAHGYGSVQVFPHGFHQERIGDNLVDIPDELLCRAIATSGVHIESILLALQQMDSAKSRLALQLLTKGDIVVRFRPGIPSTASHRGSSSDYARLLYPPEVAYQSNRCEVGVEFSGGALSSPQEAAQIIIDHIDALITHLR